MVFRDLNPLANPMYPDPSTRSPLRSSSCVETRTEGTRSSHAKGPNPPRRLSVWRGPAVGGLKKVNFGARRRQLGERFQNKKTFIGRRRGEDSVLRLVRHKFVLIHTTMTRGMVLPSPLSEFSGNTACDGNERKRFVVREWWRSEFGLSRRSSIEL